MNNVLSILKRSSTLHNIWMPVRRQYRKIKEAKYTSYPGLNGRISERDTMFAGNAKHYMEVGTSAMQNIEKALVAAGKTFGSLNEVLDMPSGHGRVLRLLATKVSPKQITACDLDEDGIDFCAKEFGCKKILSARQISKIQFPESYSLIWVGSLFTHLDQEAFTTLMRILFDSLEPGGVLVFTAHGTYSVDIFESYWAAQPTGVPVSAGQLQEKLAHTNGFYYAPYYNTKDYGVSISLQHYVNALIKNLFADKAKIVLYKERGWDNHQDVYAIERIN